MEIPLLSTFSLKESREFDPTKAKIKSFNELNEGWDYGSGHKISSHSIKQASWLYSIAKLRGLSANVAPLCDGGIDIALFKQGEDHFLDVFIRPDGTYDTTYEVGTGPEFSVSYEHENVSLETLIEEIANFSHRWSLSEQSINSNTFQESVDSQVTASIITVGEYLSSRKSALLQVAGAIANTLPDFTCPQSETQYYIGNLQRSV